VSIFFLFLTCGYDQHVLVGSIRGWCHKFFFLNFSF
jgi:hypothetical protein